MVFIIALLALSLVLVPSGARADSTSSHGKAVATPEILRPPRGSASADDLRSQVEAAFQALADAEAARRRGATAVSQREAVRKAADKIFDWREMAKDALGKHWAQATPQQRDQFTRLLAQLFERLYAPLVDRAGATGVTEVGSSIVYVSETVKGDQALVRMMWKRAAGDIAVDCAMRRRAGTWRIHDLAIDSLSVIENYRAQVDYVIQRSSYGDLVTRMEHKVSRAPITGEPERTVTASTSTRPRRELSAGDLP